MKQELPPLAANAAPMRRRTLLLLAAAIVLAAPTGALAAKKKRPAYDNLAKAPTVVSLPYRDARSIAGATIEASEPHPSCVTAAGTLWYEIRLAATTPVAVTTTGSTYNTALALYEGPRRTFSNLTKLDCLNDAGARQTSALGFVAEPGTRYFLQVVRVTTTAGVLKLRITTGAQVAIAETQVLGMASVAARHVVTGDADEVELLGRERLQVCFYGFCFPFADVGHEVTGSPEPQAPTLRNCALILFFIYQCYP